MLTLFTMLIAGSVANTDIRPLLREQGFYSPLNGRERIDYVGHIRQGRNDYRIYVYGGVFRPHPQGVGHGINRILVILNGSVFLGQYAIPLPSQCQVRGQRVICNTAGPSVITFTRRGPPSEIWFDGEVLHFEFGNRVRGS
jgi:hypothetical protein